MHFTCFVQNQASDSDELVVAVIDAGAGGEPVDEGSAAAVGVPPSPIPSSMLGTIKLSRDIKLYFITKLVKRLHKWDLASKSSNKLLW